jgi:hypothetical protein
MHPNASFIHRQGEVNAWDNADFRSAVKATGKKQVILAGIVTEVCTSFLALSLREAGYEVWANTDASGTFNDKLAADANRRMEQAGVHLMGMFGIAMDLMRDWRNTVSYLLDVHKQSKVLLMGANLDGIAGCERGAAVHGSVSSTIQLGCKKSWVCNRQWDSDSRGGRDPVKGLEGLPNQR